MTLGKNLNTSVKTLKRYLKQIILGHITRLHTAMNGEPPVRAVPEAPAGAPIVRTDGQVQSIVGVTTEWLEPMIPTTGGRQL